MNPDHPTHSWRASRWPTLGLLMLLGALCTGQLYLAIPLLERTAMELAVTSGEAAWVGSVFGLAYALGLLVLGPLSDRFGRVRTMLAGLVLAALTTAWVGTAHSLHALLAARAAQGLACAAFPVAALAFIPEHLPARQRPLALAAMGFAFLCAAPLSQLMSSALDSSLQHISLFSAPLYLLGAIVLRGLVRGETTTVSPRQRTDRPTTPAFALLRDPAMLKAWLAATPVLFSLVAFHHAMQVLGAGQGLDPAWLHWASIPPFLLAFMAAGLMKRHAAPHIAGIGFMLAASAFGLASAGRPSLLIVSTITLSSGIALAVPALMACVATLAPPDRRGLALSVYSFLLFVGASLGGAISQWLMHSGSVFAALLIPVAALVPIGTMLLRWGRPLLPMPSARF